MVECQLPKLNVAGSNPVTRLIIQEFSSGVLSTAALVVHCFGHDALDLEPSGLTSLLLSTVPPQRQALLCQTSFAQLVSMLHADLQAILSLKTKASISVAVNLL